jgi:glyoxylase-like metal-dependent hydrolase (beta-lactamase superfamily II)
MPHRSIAMTRLTTLLLLIVQLGFVGKAAAQDARTVIADAMQAMGMTPTFTSITFTGSAAYGNFLQSRRLSFGLGFTSIRDYQRTIDFTRGMSRATGLAQEPGAPNGVPPGPFDDLITPQSPGIKQLEIWTTPWGFLLGAARGPVKVKTERIQPPGEAEKLPTVYRSVTWTTPFKAPSGKPYTIIGYIGPTNLVEKVETWIDQPFMGDLEVMFSYTGYGDANGLKVPTKISQKNIGMEVYVAGPVTAFANPPDLEKLLTDNPTPRPAAPAPPAMTAVKLADGVYRLTGGYDALAVELKDQAMIIGGGRDETRALALLAETKRLFPGKTVKSAVSLHGHVDHAMVLPTFVSEGLTIYCDDSNQYFLEQSLLQPRTLLTDRLAKTKKKPKIIGIQEKLVLGDDTHRVELYHLKQIPHADGMLAAWLPKEKLLFVSDVELPVAGQAPSPSLLAVLENIDSLALNFDTFMTNGPDSIEPISRTELFALIQKRK